MTSKNALLLLAVCTMIAPPALASAQPASAPPAAVDAAAALNLARTYNCLTCHAIDKKVIGPAWKDVAAKYRDQAEAEEKLVQKVSKGGKGVWGNTMAMPAFGPHVPEADIRTLVKFILELK